MGLTEVNCVKAWSNFVWTYGTLCVLINVLLYVNGLLLDTVTAHLVMNLRNDGTTVIPWYKELLMYLKYNVSQ